jgi:hypothetical protein
LIFTRCHSYQNQQNLPMNPAAFSELLSVVDDAVQLADDAVKAAQAAQQPVRPVVEQVTLVKVAKNKCHELAEVLHKTGAFREFSRDQLAKAIEAAGPLDLVEMMEKLASRAVFPIDADEVLGGDLVEKSAASRTYNGLAPDTPTAIWRKALDEAELECAG